MRSFHLIFIRKRLKETKEKVLADREHIKRQKEYDKLSIEKRTELKKKLNDFRQVITSIQIPIDRSISLI